MIKRILDGARKLVRRIKRAYYVLIGREIEIVLQSSDVYSLLEKQTTAFNNRTIEDKFSNIEHLLHYLATRVEILAREQREMKEGQVKQNSNVEELINALSSGYPAEQPGSFDETIDNDYHDYGESTAGKKPVLN